MNGPERFALLLGAVREEYDEIVKNEVQRASRLTNQPFVAWPAIILITSKPTPCAKGARILSPDTMMSQTNA